METSRFISCLAADHALLRAAAAAAPAGATVPSCPGWTALDLVTHVAAVYLNKAATMRQGRQPDPWPPVGYVDPASIEAAVAGLDRAYAELSAEFAARPAGSPAVTWYGPDQSVGFWIRRMAQETAVHRIDAELVAGLPLTPVPDDLAADGVDEVLRVMLSYGAETWPEDFAELERPEGAGAVVVTAGERSWTVRPSPTRVLVEDGAAAEARAVVSGPPDAVLRWSWSRGADEVNTDGDQAWADYLRRLLRTATQ